MKMRVWATVAGLCVTVGAAAGQSAQDSAKALRDELTGKDLYLRDFSVAHVIRWQWDGARLVEKPPVGHMASIVKVESVKLDGNALKIEASRRTMVRDSDGRVKPVTSTEPIEIDVDLNGDRSADVLPKVAQGVFYSDVHEVGAALAGRSWLVKQPGSAEEIEARIKAEKVCDCAHLDAPDCSVHEVAASMKGVDPPRLLSASDPDFTEAARKKNVRGNAQVHVSVDSAGRPQDIWISRPLGYGLDENAVRSVSGYVFRPATCHGRAFGMGLYIDVNFEQF
ncbi:MAG: energy transducer TonB [Acidobacteriota bacterium]